MRAGKGGESHRRRFQPLGVLGRVAHPEVGPDLLEPRNLVRVLERKLLLQLAAHLLLVELLQPSRRRRLDGLSGSGRSLRLGLLFRRLWLLLLLLLLGLRLFFLLLWFVRHRYLTLGIG